MTQKRLTVTFEDVEVVVHGLGEDYGSTCTSVVTDLIPGMNGRKSERVRTIQEVRRKFFQLADHGSDYFEQDVWAGSPR